MVAADIGPRGYLNRGGEHVIPFPLADLLPQ